MKPTCVLTAVNANPKYTRFIPAFIAQWTRLYPDIKVRIVWIGSEIPEEFKPYSENIILFPELAEVSSVYSAQTIRILYPALMDPTDVTIITDMDMLPGNTSYFTMKLEGVRDDAFVSMRPLSVVSPGQIAMCYTVASTSVWQRLFGIRSENDIRAFLVENYNPSTDGIHGGKGWYQDQELLYRHVVHDPSFVQLDDSGFRRLDYFHHRYDMNQFLAMLRSGQYSDAHFYADACPWTLVETMNIV